MTLSPVPHMTIDLKAMIKLFKIRKLKEQIAQHDKEFKIYWEYVKTNNDSLDQNEVEKYINQFRDTADILNKALELAIQDAGEVYYKSLKNNTTE